MASDDDWGDIDSLPKKSQAPKLLFCAAGCILPLLALVAILSWGYSTYNAGRDEEAQWGALAEILPHDERPEGWNLVFGFQPGLLSFAIGEQVYLFSDGETLEEMGDRVLVLVWTSDDVEPMFDTTADEVEPYVPPVAEGEQPAEALETLRVQGRDLRVSVLRGGDEPGSGLLGGGHRPEADADHPAVALDLTPVGSPRSLVLIAHGKDGPMSPEELIGFLAPFEVGPER